MDGLQFEVDQCMDEIKHDYESEFQELSCADYAGMVRDRCAVSSAWAAFGGNLLRARAWAILFVKYKEMYDVAVEVGA